MLKLLRFSVWKKCFVFCLLMMRGPDKWFYQIKRGWDTVPLSTNAFEQHFLHVFLVLSIFTLLYMCSSFSNLTEWIRIIYKLFSLVLITKRYLFKQTLQLGYICVREPTFTFLWHCSQFPDPSWRRWTSRWCGRMRWWTAWPSTTGRGTRPAPHT